MFRVAKHLMRTATAEAIDVSESDGVRALHLGSPTIQSAMRISRPHALELAYTRGMMCFLLFNSRVKHVLSIGLGGGSLVKYLHAYCPTIVTQTVEINPTIIRIARSQFFVPEDDARLQIIEGDGLQYLAEHTEATEVLLVDAFDSHGIPPNFCSQDFFDQCARALCHEGMLVINLWGGDKNFDAYVQRIEQSFSGCVLQLPTGKPGNVVVFGFMREPSDLRIASLRMRAKDLEQTHAIEFLQFVEKLADHNPSSHNRLFMTKNKTEIE